MDRPGTAALNTPPSTTRREGLLAWLLVAEVSVLLLLLLGLSALLYGLLRVLCCGG